MAASPPESGRPEDEPARPDASRLDEGMGADEVELELAHGPDVWDGPQGDLAEDVVAMRELIRRGYGDALFDELVGSEELQRLFRRAFDAGDRELARSYGAAFLARNPEALRRALGRGPEEGDSQAGDDGPPETDSPVGAPLPSGKVKGPDNQHRN